MGLQSLGVMPYERYKAWQLAHALALQVFNATDAWPVTERYLLTAQIRRAALSVPANVAEGAARHGPREFRRFLNIALGSLSELSYLLRFARDRGLLPAVEWERLDGIRNETGRTRWGLLRAVVRRAESAAPPP